MEISSIRFVAVGIIVIGCFSYLYPKLLHPVVLSMLGYSTQPNEQASNARRPFIPHGGQHDVPPAHPGDHEDIKRYMKPGPHPGLRAAAAEMQSKQAKSGRGGMMGIVLPMYAVGIVLYLMYTLFKVFGKKDKKTSDQETEGRVSNGQQHKNTGSILSSDLQRAQEGLDQFLNKAGDCNLKEDEMRQLQERLAETEAQMTKILQAMQAVQQKVKKVAEPEGQPSEEMVTKEEKDAKPGSGDDSNGSVSSTESYEMVNKPYKENGSEGSSSQVEILYPEDLDQNLNTVQMAEENEKDEDRQIEEENDVLFKEKVDTEDHEDSSVRRRKHQPADSDS
ncbi:hypothetical protein CHS0354_010372 [Potamilus streckersoni]|uniref:Resistance to inhibitors of cholinesterase protein 3 N-terminal domain-containing protein n=1 Tax=Potamilus streckersoni TaxID=2493646 RepID=A0AAE0WAV9_9BIVA|nr:hypothetical protein CHS0354_010372 [Potamilus streckersoni]